MVGTLDLFFSSSPPPPQLFFIYRTLGTVTIVRMTTRFSFYWTHMPMYNSIYSVNTTTCFLFSPWELQNNLSNYYALILALNMELMQQWIIYPAFKSGICIFHNYHVHFILVEGCCIHNSYYIGYLLLFSILFVWQTTYMGLSNVSHSCVKKLLTCTCNRTLIAPW